MSHTNLKTINSVEINNSGPFRVGDQLTSGTTGQVLKSLGDSLSPEWSNDTDTTYQGSTTINIDTATDPDTINVLKVPNALTFTGTDTGTFDGSSALSINLTDTDTTYQGSSTINIDTTTDPDTINVLKVPNVLTAGTNITYNSGTTYDGSTAITISATDTNTTYTVADPITLSAGNEIGLEIDGNTIFLDGAELAVAKVPNVMTAGTNISMVVTADGSSATTYDGSDGITITGTDTDTTYQGSSTINIDTTTTPDTINALKVPNVMTAGSNISMVNTSDGSSATTYDGSVPITITGTSSGTTYQGGTNISIDTSTTPDSINLDPSIMNQTLLLFNQTGITTGIIGSAYPNKPTTVTYLDLSSALNIISGGVLATKVQRTASFRSFGTTYAEYSSNFRTSFVATSTNIMVEFRGIIRADNKVFYGGLYDYNSGVYQADTRNRFNYNDESDQDMTTMTWWMRNLTKGTTYYISPYFRGSSGTVYIYAGHTGSTDGFAPAIMRIYDGGNNVGIY